MDKLWLVIKAETSAALETLAQWVASQKGDVCFRGVRVMTSVDCHRRGDVVFLVETRERNLHRVLAERSDGQPWDGSILKLDDFDSLLGHSKELLVYDSSEDAAGFIRKAGEAVVFPVDVGRTYVVKGPSLYELRQNRFKAQYLAGVEHPHDVCALARSVEEMRGMIAGHFDDADFSAVQMSV